MLCQSLDATLELDTGADGSRYTLSRSMKSRGTHKKETDSMRMAVCLPSHTSTPSYRADEDSQHLIRNWSSVYPYSQKDFESCIRVAIHPHGVNTPALFSPKQ